MTNTTSKLRGPHCLGKSRQTGEPCKLPPIPFGEYCRFHGGNRKQHREKARQAMLEYERWSSDPWYVKQIRIRQWQEADERYQMRRARQTSPEAVAGLKRERAAEKAEKQREFAENKRLKAEKHRAAAEEARRRKGQPPQGYAYDGDCGDGGYGDIGHAIAYEMDWEV